MARYRSLDPQTARWWQIDPEVEAFYAWSPYHSNLGNPVRYEDRDGDFPWNVVIGFGIGAGWEAGTQIVSNMAGGDDFSTAVKKVDLFDVFVEGGKGALKATGFGGVILSGAAEYGGEVLKASTDISLAKEPESVFNGTKSKTDASIDLGVNVVGGKVFDATLGKATKNVAATTKANAEHAGKVAMYADIPIQDANATQKITHSRAKSQAASSVKTARAKANVAKGAAAVTDKAKGVVMNQTSEATKKFVNNNQHYLMQGTPAY